LLETLAQVPVPERIRRLRDRNWGQPEPTVRWIEPDGLAAEGGV
jgi:hypothetical protein